MYHDSMTNVQNSLEQCKSPNTCIWQKFLINKTYRLKSFTHHPGHMQCIAVGYDNGIW